MYKMKNLTYIYVFLLLGSISQIFAQQANKAKNLLDEVSNKMGAYTNMQIDFKSSLSNADAGIAEGDESPIIGSITLEGEKYNLSYLGNNFLFDGKKLYIINHEEKEISTNDGDFDDTDGFIYPSKLLTFYKEGYNYKLGKSIKVKGKKIQIVVLTPIDSDSEIVKVELGIELKTKHIYKLTQLGANSAKTTFTITSFKKNQQLQKDTFLFNKDTYLKKKYSID